MVGGRRTQDATVTYYKILLVPNKRSNCFSLLVLVTSQQGDADFEKEYSLVQNNMFPCSSLKLNYVYTES